MLNFSAKEMGDFGAPSLITRNTNDVHQVQMLVLMTCTLLAGAPIIMIGGVIMAIRQDIGLSWLIVVAVVALGAVISMLAAYMTPLFQLMQERIDNINRVLREQIGGIRVIRAFVREPYEAKRFGTANAELTDTAIKTGRFMVIVYPVVLLALNVPSVGVLWFGGQRVDSGVIQIGQLTAFLAYLMQILISVMMATMLIVQIPRASTCAGRILEVCDTEPSVRPPAAPVSRLHGRGEVTLDRVSFSYPGAEDPVLRDITFKLQPGQTTAIVGSTGAGKTTLVNLIPRLYDPTRGEIHIDGVDVGDLTPEALWQIIGLVPQKPYLFSGTVASNLRFGDPEASDEELWHALTVAQAADFVREFPEGLDHPISQGGTNVSGGQRQRLAIARALVRRPEVYIFDDSFSALDVATDARLRAALAQETRDASVLIVAQRVSTITGADQILVLEHGEIVGRGTHQELLAECSTYAEIVESQLSAEEAA